MPNRGAYRLRAPTTGIQGTGSATRAVLIPIGALIHVAPNAHVNGESFISCTWEGSEITILAFDLKERGEAASSAGE